MSKVATTLVGAVGLLQGVLTAVGATNGGLAALILNEPTLAWIGLALVVLAMLIIGVYAVFNGTGTGWKVAGTVGVIAIIGGLTVTGYAALVAPTLAAEPNIAASVTWGSPITLQATIKSSAVERDDVFHIEVDGLKEKQSDHSYVLSSPVLYQAQLGSDGSGDVNVSLTIPIPNDHYDDIGISAWSGEHAGPCGSLKQSKSTIPSGNTTSYARKGCVVVHLAGLPPNPAIAVRDTP
ncbi:MAG TPA: hypothetical protein VGG98_03200 [Solirubrobacteraceae bacterium]|jgi:hypothetical protein